VSEAHTGGRAGALRRFKPYPAYKDSGVEWLGDIPAHWGVCALRRKLFRGAGSIKIGPFGSALKLEIMVQEGFKVYGQEHVIARDFSRGSKYIDHAKFSELAACEIRPRDILVTMMGSTGRSAVVPEGIEKGIMDSHLLRIRLPDAELHPRFLALLIDEAEYVRDQIGAAGKGAIMHGLNSSIIKSIVLATPPTTEQSRILSFIDRETARIDALVAKKERLIELLQEKRRALITHAVTKGLDPNVPMKDSEVEWLGKIPAHWEVKRLWHLTPSDRRIMYGIVLPGPNVDDGVPIVKGGDVSPERLRLDRVNRTTREIESGYARSRLRGGDLVYAIRGSIGEVAIVPDELQGANLTQDAARIAYTSATHGPWLVQALKSAAVFAQLEAGALGATIRGINIRDLKRASVAVPSRVEQLAIAACLDRETGRIDALVANVRQAIERLNELRAALISAAVTGKIDVRGEIE
jgi:type I restriction enzyme S subunit